MRKRIVTGNWKMNLNYKEALSLVTDVIDNIPKNTNIEVIFAPSYLYLSEISNMCRALDNIKIAAQDCSVEGIGAFTGDVSASMILSVNADYVIIGHSERRKYYNESNVFLKNKVNRVLDSNLGIIFCCGESIIQRENNEHFDLIESQLNESLFHLSRDEFKNIIIAYEPIWAIGTGVNATAEQAQEIHKFIRRMIKDRYGSDISEEVSVLYGGSCNPSNAKDLFNKDDIDGGLIGGASLQSQNFLSIINSF
tara:strand:+ start:36187 stop:36942 length:756 start_codon:yes stop_codon:yes gene_type:complete